MEMDRVSSNWSFLFCALRLSNCETNWLLTSTKTTNASVIADGSRSPMMYVFDSTQVAINCAVRLSFVIGSELVHV